MIGLNCSLKIFCMPGPFGSTTSAKSSPAQKPFPLPVKYTQRTSFDALHSSNFCCNNNAISRLNEFNFSGRFNVTNAISFCMSNKMLSIFMLWEIEDDDVKLCQPDLYVFVHVLQMTLK